MSIDTSYSIYKILPGSRTNGSRDHITYKKNKNSNKDGAEDKSKKKYSDKLKGNKIDQYI